jgi:hypothetical protein
MTQLVDHCKEASTSVEARIYNLRLGATGRRMVREKSQQTRTLRSKISTSFRTGCVPLLSEFLVKHSRDNSKVGSNFAFAKRRELVRA